jgi:hypothetical protein
LKQTALVLAPFFYRALLKEFIITFMVMLFDLTGFKHIYDSLSNKQTRRKKYCQTDWHGLTLCVSFIRFVQKAQHTLVNIQDEHKRTLHTQNDTENKCGALRTSHLHQSIEKHSKFCLK